jgi:hypothetical protein
MTGAISHWLDVRDKPGLLHRLMVELGDDAQISLEGSLSQCSFPDEIVVSREQVGPLKRNTMHPRQDFIVLRLTPDTIAEISQQISLAGLKNAIVHVQIERSGVLEFGAYDNFHPDCVVAGPGISVSLLDELKQKHLLRDFTVATSNG